MVTINQRQDEKTLDVYLHNKLHRELMMLTWARLSNGCLNVFGWAVSAVGLFLVLLQSMNVFNRYFFAENKYFGLMTLSCDRYCAVGGGGGCDGGGGIMSSRFAAGRTLSEERLNDPCCAACLKMSVEA